MKILYVAGNRNGSYFQLKRYLPIFKSTEHIFQIAGYKKSLKEINTDYCLDALLNFSKPEDKSISFNGNFSFYAKEIYRFNPDLILSDFDIYTSIIALEKNIPLWQISPALLYYGLEYNLKRKIGINKFNTNIISKDLKTNQYIKNILNGSKRKLVLSHLCDLEPTPQLEEGYEWCRPEFELNNINRLQESCGYGVELADAFYNLNFTNLTLEDIDIESAPGTYANIYFGLSKLRWNTQDLNNYNFKISINNSVKFLKELI